MSYDKLKTAMFTPRDQPAELYQAIGEVVVTFAFIELMLTQLLKILATTMKISWSRDERLLCIIGADDMHPLTEKLRRLFEYCISDPILLKKLKNHLKTISELSSERNDYTHTGHWQPLAGNLYLKMKYVRTSEIEDHAVVSIPMLKTLSSKAKKELFDLAALFIENLPEIKRQWKAKRLTGKQTAIKIAAKLQADIKKAQEVEIE